MTTKKKVGISDLLRDEVQKSSTGNEPNEKTIEVKSETVVDQPQVSQVSTTVSELARSPKREPEVLQAIADLQKDLKFSQTNVELLQKSLAAIESLKDELDQQLVEVKRDNLRLAEANIKLLDKLSEQIAAADPVESPPTSQLVPQTSQQPSPQNRATPRKQPVDQPYSQRDRTPYTRPTGSNEQLQRINNKNIGWMD